MIIELESPTATEPGDTQGVIIVAQNGTITTKRIVDDKPVPYLETTPEGDFEAALAEHINSLTASGYVVVG